jgi:hypothetical protein
MAILTTLIFLEDRNCPPTIDILKFYTIIATDTFNRERIMTFVKNNRIGELKLSVLPIEIDEWAVREKARMQDLARTERAPVGDRNKWGWLTTTIIFALVFVGIVFAGRAWNTSNQQTQVEVVEIRAGTYHAPNTGGPFSRVITTYKGLYNLDTWDQKLDITE